MTILGKRTEQLNIFCCVTGFTSDFLSFIDVELIPFFQLFTKLHNFLVNVIYVHYKIIYKSERNLRAALYYKSKCRRQ